MNILQIIIAYLSSGLLAILVAGSPVPRRLSSPDKSLSRRDLESNILEKCRPRIGYEAEVNFLFPRKGGHRSSAPRPSTSHAANGPSGVAKPSGPKPPAHHLSVRQKFAHAFKKVGHAFKAVGRWIKKTGAGIVKFGMQIAATAQIVVGKALKFCSVCKPMAARLESSGKMMGTIAEHIPGRMNSRLTKGFNIMHKIQHPEETLIKLGVKGVQKAIEKKHRH